jgi:hypothetical protein
MMKKMKYENKKNAPNSRFSFLFPHSSVSRGYFTLLVLVFASVFFTLLSALTGFVFMEKRAQIVQEQREQAFHIAEAGLEYYRWHLAHWPTDIRDGTSGNGPYVHDVPDPEGATLGNFALSFVSTQACGTSTNLIISSVGRAAAAPQFQRTLKATYAWPTVADYAYVVNSNVWVGADRVINGPYHSNGGVRMDGTHNATVSSGVSTWLCTSTLGCSPNQTKPGVFGIGGPQSLWKFPAPPIDFQGIITDIVALKEYARNNGGIYFGQAGGESNRHGYHMTFNGDGTFTVKNVKDTTRVWGYTVDGGWQYEYPVIEDERDSATYPIPPTCQVIFFNDRVWIDGVVSGKVTVAAAALQQPNYGADVILNGDITYKDGSAVDGLTVIAEHSIIVGLKTPDTMNINGIFIAQQGHFGRNHYCTDECDSAHNGNEGVPANLDPYVRRSTLNTLGTVVSNRSTGTKWTSGGVFVSGYNQRNDSYDRRLAKSPPPFTPRTSDDLVFVDWREQN